MTPEELERAKQSRPKWRKCRRPFFWCSIVVLIQILIDAMIEQLQLPSVLEQHHWIALRVFDLILSIQVLLQSKKLESLLDEKEANFL